MNVHETHGLNWRKSSHSSAQHSDCVEIADAGLRVAVRDSKDPEGPRLAVSLDEWRTFTSAVKARP
ncbi:DUF397 domain-containing protein [Actinomadura logoneensis]|uniref:DUF397 domain-containing protein n=1 Tax=Actinomadura logoneensis TaxID=2293572 RepID=A0A372JLH6_9ACTN|nr:DUF397 domain-containing protein [Actinomadura logoneensis]RFU40845.1 DUF397 domain-containing protein [Actinomadura logoneensis]